MYRKKNEFTHMLVQGIGRHYSRIVGVCPFGADGTAVELIYLGGTSFFCRRNTIRGTQRCRKLESGSIPSQICFEIYCYLA